MVVYCSSEPTCHDIKSETCTLTHEEYSVEASATEQVIKKWINLWPPYGLSTEKEQS